MQFTKFKKIFLTYGICEIDFSFIDDKNRLIRIENYSHENGKRLITVGKKKIYFTNCIEIFEIKLIDNKTLEELWCDVQIDIIDGMDALDYEKWYQTVDCYDLEYFYDYQIKKTISTKELINKLSEDEYNGELLLLAGTEELLNLDPNNFKVVVDVPRINRYYLIESQDGVTYINILISFIYEIRRQVNKDKTYKVGRLITFYRDKNANSKSQKYRELLKYEKSLNSLFEGGFFMIMIVANICCILYCITIVKEKPFLLVISILVFILLWIIIFRFGKYKTKKQLEFKEKYFPNINQNDILNYEMDKIILEKYETKFESLIAKIKNINSKIKVSGFGFENNSIDLQFELNNKGLYFDFSPKILFVIDEMDKTYYFKYDKYSYDELEKELVKFVINHFN